MHILCMCSKAYGVTRNKANMYIYAKSNQIYENEKQVNHFFFNSVTHFRIICGEMHFKIKFCL